jgi:hypothetical protein
MSSDDSNLDDTLVSYVKLTGSHNVREATDKLRRLMEERVAHGRLQDKGEGWADQSLETTVYGFKNRTLVQRLRDWFTPKSDGQSDL